MTLALYVDVHVHYAIVAGLQLRGVDVLTAQADGFRTANDPDLLDRATELQRVVFTNDRDFLVIARKRQAQNIAFGGVIFAAQTTSIGVCVADLELIAKVFEPDEIANRVRYIPL